jgi:galacturonokinase
MQDSNTRATLRDAMRSRYGIGPERVRFVWAPYRICPLGAHIDHQLGVVTGMAIDRGVYLAFAPSDSAEVRLNSLDYAGEVRFRVDAVPPRQPGDWGNYARGAVVALSRDGPLAHGLVGVASGGLAEVGLSSSASIGVAYLLALEEANGLQRTPAENIHLDQAIENEYLGLNNGILDQSAILCSRRDRLTVIDCKTFSEASALGHAPGLATIPPGSGAPPFAIFVAFSGLSKSVISTDYNRRVAECAEAARLLLQAAGRPLAPARLGLVTREEFLAHGFLLGGAAARRAEHFFSEMDRVRQGIAAWRQGDVAAFGHLMRESGRSSILNYECGSPPLADLCEILNRTPGIYGARFCGAGFRGCCVALAKPEAAAQAIPAVQKAYAARQPELAARAQFFLCQSSDGARLL